MSVARCSLYPPRPPALFTVVSVASSCASLGRRLVRTHSMDSLPPGFEAAQDGEGYTYYYNLSTGESTYDVPGGGGGERRHTPANSTSTH